MGIGLLALPWAFVNLGWSAIIICFLFGAIHAATAVLLGKCQRSIPGLPRSFQEVADVAFGLRGRLALFHPPRLKV
jgi:amino acid permease